MSDPVTKEPIKFQSSFYMHLLLLLLVLLLLSLCQNKIYVAAPQFSLSAKEACEPVYNTKIHSLIINKLYI